jgi:hypothetical protein
MLQVPEGRDVNHASIGHLCFVVVIVFVRPLSLADYFSRLLDRPSIHPSQALQNPVRVLLFLSPLLIAALLLRFARCAVVASLILRQLKLAVGGRLVGSARNWLSGMRSW